MYKIKDFSNRIGLSITTLRYYDEIDLFKPSYTDIYSGYRYYENNQISLILKIENLKKVGLSLDEIKNYIKTDDKNILINKIRGYENMIDKINDLILETENKYKVFKSNYNKYLELRGVLNSNCVMAIEIRNNNADYYYIEENDVIVNDFVIYKDTNSLTLREEFKNKKLIDKVFNEIKKDYESVNIYIPIEMVDLINYIKENYEFESQIKSQGDFQYDNIKFNLVKY